MCEMREEIEESRTLDWVVNSYLLYHWATTSWTYLSRHLRLDLYLYLHSPTESQGRRFISFYFLHLRFRFGGLGLIFLSHTLLHLHFYPFIRILQKLLFIITHFFEEEIINHYHHHYHYHYHYHYHLLSLLSLSLFFIFSIYICTLSLHFTTPWVGSGWLGRVRLNLLGLAGLGRVRFGWVGSG